MNISLEEFGLELYIENHSGRIIKSLNDKYGDDSPEDDHIACRLTGALDALDSLILAHACNDIDITGKAYRNGIQTSLDAILNNLG